MENIGLFLFNIGKSLLGLGDKLYAILTQSVNIAWVAKIVEFFGASLDIPSEISLIWILTGGGVVVIAILIIAKVVL